MNKLCAILIAVTFVVAVSAPAVADPWILAI